MHSYLILEFDKCVLLILPVQQALEILDFLYQVFQRLNLLGYKHNYQQHKHHYKNQMSKFLGK